MPVNWQRFPISFGQGLDGNADPKQVVPGRLLTLENGVFDKLGSINKRHGLASRSLGVEGTGSITRGVALAAFDNESLMFDGDYAWTWLAGSSEWLRRGVARSLETTTRPIVAGTTAYRNPDVAITGSLALYVYEAPDPSRFGFSVSSYYGVRCTLVDTDTGAVIINNQLCALTGTNPRAVAFSGSLYALYAGPSNSHLIARRIDPSSPSVLGPEARLASNVRIRASLNDAANGWLDGFYRGARLDAVATSDRLFVAYDVSVGASADGVVLCGFTSSLSTLGLSASVTMSNNNGGSPVALWTDASENVWLASPSGSWNGGTFLQNNAPIRAQVWTNRFQTLMTATNVTALSGTGAAVINSLAGVCASGSASNVYYEVSSSSDTSYRLMVARFGPGLASTSASFKRSVGLESRPFVWEGKQYLWTLFGSSEQPTYFLLDGDGNVASKANALRAGPLRTSNSVSSVVQPESGSFLFAGERRGRVLSDSGSLFTFPGIAGTTVSFVSTTGSFWSAKLGRQLHVVGGVLSSYDGLSFVEHGFHTYPEQLSASLSTASGSVVSGSYQYCATYEWTDAVGQVHRSRPSLPITVNLTGSFTTPTGSITITVPTLRLTAKESASPIGIAIWRTEDAGDVFYKVTPVTASLTGSTALDSVSFRDVLSDSQLISRELLYTTSGELENDAPPTCTMVETWQNRVWLGGLEDPNTLRYSKRSVYDEAIGFPAEFEIRIDPDGGEITAIKALADNLIVFKERSIHRVYPLTGDGTPYGGGPDNTGAGGDWGQAPIASDVGCINVNSVERTDMGVFFQSAKGIYLLGRDLSLSYVGAAVEELLEDLTITSANLVARDNQVRFSCSDGVTLVYDYAVAVNAWSTFTNPESVDAAVVGGTYMILRSNGVVDVEDTTSFDDNDQEIKLRLVTGWLSLAGIQGYQRVRRAYVLGDYVGAHSLKVKAGYDYKSAFDDEATVDAQAVCDPAGELYEAGDGELYQFRFDLSRQKCTAIRLSLEDVQTSGFNEGLRLSNLALEVGTKQGGNKLRPGRQGGLT